jgi:hypothetical protein
MIDRASRAVSRIRLAIAIAAFCAAAAGTRPYAGGWNDGSRLATVEALVDYDTFAIDESVFVDPSRATREGGMPFGRGVAAGTLDKLLIAGRFYSDKSPVPALPMALVYLSLQRATGLVARHDAAAFSYAMSLLTAGLSYALAVAGMFTLAYACLRSSGRAAVVTVSFGAATTALVYACAVNNHIVLLALATWTMVAWQRIANAEPAESQGRRVIALGVLAGAAYTVDLAAGPILAAASVALLLWRNRRTSTIACWLAGAAPFVLLHHAITYRLAGTIAPANTVPEYLAYPGSPFDAATLTGGWHHASAFAFLVYAGDLLVGRRGFLFHDLPMLCAGPALVTASRLRARVADWAPLACGAGFLVFSWLAYAALSTNHSGVCASVRWFVPWLAPAFYAICVGLREDPASWRGFLALSAWGAIVGVLLWRLGPWTFSMVPLYWVWVAGALVHWTWMDRRAALSGPPRA